MIFPKRNMKASKILDGWNLSKYRYHEDFTGHKFGVDFFLGNLSQLAMCEVESESEIALSRIEFPRYALCEVTTNRFFTGGNLCKATSVDLEVHLKEYPSF